MTEKQKKDLLSSIYYNDNNDNDKVSLSSLTIQERRN